MVVICNMVMRLIVVILKGMERFIRKKNLVSSILNLV